MACWELNPDPREFIYAPPLFRPGDVAVRKLLSEPTLVPYRKSAQCMKAAPPPLVPLPP